MKVDFKVAVTALILFFSSMVLFSEEPAIDPQRFKTSPFSNDYLTVYSGSGLDSANWGLGFFFNYQPDPISLFDSEGNKAKTVIGDQFTVDISGFYSPLKWLDIGLVIPVVAYQDGAGWGNDKTPPSAGIGDMRLIPRFQLYNFSDGLFAVSLITEVMAPTGRQIHKAMGKANFSFRPALALSSDSQFFAAAVNFFYHLQEKQMFRETPFDDEFGVKVALAGKFIPGWLDVVGEFSAVTSIDKPFDNSAVDHIEAGGAFRIGTPVGMDITAGASAGIGSALASPKYRVFLGISYSGRHGVKKVQTEEVDEREEVEEAEEEIDIEEVEEIEAEIKDAIADEIEAEIEAEMKAEMEDEEEDEIEEPAPEVKPEPVQKPAPRPAPKKAEKTGQRLQEVVYFFENSARLVNQIEVEKVAMILTRNYTLRVRIEAHTDMSEPARLARARGQAVEDILVRNGVDQKRITLVTFGSTEPVSTGDTEPDKRRNRRVEFFIVTD